MTILDTSKMELISREFFLEILGDYKVEYNIRPDWLKNLKTGKNLEIDIYFPEIKIGFEINGGLHAFRVQKNRDKIKNRLCKFNGVRLITINSLKEFNREHFKKLIKSITGKDVCISNTLYKKIKRYSNYDKKHYDKKISNILGIERKKELWGRKVREASKVQKMEAESNRRRMEFKRLKNK
jgi:hypothetical protein